MKRLLSIFALFCLFTFPLLAADATFQWDYGTPMPSGFEMTVTPTTGSAIVFDCGASPSKTCTVTGINAGSFSATVRAYNIGVPATLKVYSSPSNAVSFTIPGTPAAPTNNRIFAVVMAGVTAIGIFVWALIKKLRN